MKKILFIIFAFLPIAAHTSGISINCSSDINAIPEGRIDLLCKQPVEPSATDITKEQAIEIAKQAISLNCEVPEWLPNSKIETTQKDSSINEKYWRIIFRNPQERHDGVLNRGIIVDISQKGVINTIGLY